jgi:hypothetical protein
MFVDSSGALGIEHAQDLRRAGIAHRLARAATAGVSPIRAFAARGQFGRLDTYRAR